MQILTNKKALHFTLTPYLKNIYRSKILFLHYSNTSPEKRREKYLKYTREDINRDQVSYEHILNDKPKLKNIEDIRLDSLV